MEINLQGGCLEWLHRTALEMAELTFNWSDGYSGYGEVEHAWELIDDMVDALQHVAPRDTDKDKEE